MLKEKEIPPKCATDSRSLYTGSAVKSCRTVLVSIRLAWLSYLILGKEDLGGIMPRHRKDLSSFSGLFFFLFYTDRLMPVQAASYT